MAADEARPDPDSKEALAFFDDDGNRVALDSAEALLLFGLTEGLGAATVSACPGCRSRVVAVLALLDLLDARPYHLQRADLAELADDAPTLHLYVEDLAADCEHNDWLDPGFTEWSDALGDTTYVRRATP